MNDEIILTTLKEIRDDQKIVVEKLARMDRELEISRNGYTPHQVVELLHWVDDQMRKEEKRNDTIKKAIISWAVPMMLSAMVLGIFMMNKIQ